MEGKRFIHKIRIKNLLSFDEEGIDLELQPLNVLIGPNGSGKSNFLDALSTLNAASDNLVKGLSTTGGIHQWLNLRSDDPIALIETTIAPLIGNIPMKYGLCFKREAERLEVVDEYLENEFKTDELAADVYFYYRFNHGQPMVNYREIRGGNPLIKPEVQRALSGRHKPGVRTLKHEDVRQDQSVLSQFKDKFQLPELTHVGQQFGAMQFFRSSLFGRDAAARKPQPADLPYDRLMEDGKNLVAVIDSMIQEAPIHEDLIGRLMDLYPRLQDVRSLSKGGTVQLYVKEKGLRELLSAMRLSDGTVRFLCMYSLLREPTPPPLLCIDEPETGLHPDMIHKIADLLKDAATRVQVIVTTHSDLLVSALSDVPEAIVVCEHDGNGTRMERLEPDKLKGWLENYHGKLGELWLRGHIGGTRW
jgi:predicted ATPase